MDYKTAILGFKPTFDSVKDILAEREKLYLPLNSRELEIAIRFGGFWFNGADLNPVETSSIEEANFEFQEMKSKCPQILSCDPTNREYPFTVILSGNENN